MDAIAALIEAGADGNAKNNDGETALYVAKLFGKTAAIDMLTKQQKQHKRNTQEQQQNKKKDKEKKPKKHKEAKKKQNEKKEKKKQKNSKEQKKNSKALATSIVNTTAPDKEESIAPAPLPILVAETATMVSESISTATTKTDSVPFMKTKASAAVPDYSPISPAALKGIQTLTNNGGNNVINIYNIEQPAAAASAAAILAANGIHTFQPILGGGIGSTVKFAAPPTETTTLTAPATLPHKKCDERLSGTGADYRGCQDHTISGTLCQAWDLQHPHVHVRNTPETNPEDGLDGNNYCRNPDPNSDLHGIKSGIWCLTTDPTVVWERCAPKTNCDERFSGNANDYRGCQDHTISGTMCQAWDLQHPHVHVRNTPETNPEDGLDGNNYCRNPGNSHTEMWCYTSLLEKVWEACLPLR